jgi:PKHD-type hydroxylase
VRLAAVGWIESFVADAAQREILFDLSVTRARLSEAGAAREDLLRLDKSISNLLRMWAR